MCRAYTKEETREMFLEHIRTMVNYWFEEARTPNPKKKLDGLAFSILTMLDGGSAGLPAFDISPSPHPEDKEYHEKEGDNWFEDGLVINDDVQLHEMFIKYD